MGSSFAPRGGVNRHERRKQAALRRQLAGAASVKSSRLARRFQPLETLEKRELLSSIQVTIDYSFDTNGFFSDPLRRELLQAAANMVVRDFTDTLDAINPDANNTWTADFTHPGDGSDVSEANLLIAQNEIVIYAGGRDLGGPLGEGGPGGFSVSFFDQAFADAVVGRGEAGALDGSDTDFASWGGSITFDNTATWHFGFSTDGLGAGENDFLSVAMHEVAHLLGFGTSASFQNLINFGNATFTGTQSVAANGGNPVPLANEGHWQNGIQSGGQEAAMDPDLTVGTRKVMTPLDNAALEDLGWDLVPAIGVVTNTNDSGPGSLRQAILDLNAGIVPVDAITFNINVNDPGFIDIDSALPGGDADADVFRINLLSELPDITRANASINGDSQSSYLASDLNAFGPEIWIRGGGIPEAGGTSGLTLDAENIFIQTLAISGFDSPFSAGIFVTDNGNNATISRNYLGVNPTGLTAEANDNGIIISGADNVRITGDRSESPQVISGNNNQGVFIEADATNTRIQGNFIGVGRDGATDLGNNQHGVSIRSGSGHFVGSDGDGNIDLQEGNTIGGNAIEGVHLEGPVTGVTIAGNLIGITENGAAVPNTFGISLIGPEVTGNFIGIENVPFSRNIISGNNAEGVRILAGASGNTLVGNFIGIDSFDVAVPNGGLAGVLIEASDSNVIGTAGNGNVISGNNADGILLRAFNGDGADNNTIVANLIGVGADGVTGLGNGARGVAIFNSSGNAVGVAGDVSFSNVISGNAQEGVAIFDEDQEGETLTATNNTIANNFIGTDRDSVESNGNGGAGVLIEAADSNTVGGFNNGESGELGGNVIVNNPVGGVRLTRQANSNSILGNFIGVTRDRTPMGNDGDGVAILDSSFNFVGTDAIGSENFIGANVGAGVSIVDVLPFVGVVHAGAANFNVVVNNFIGTDNFGTQDLGNDGEGVYISAGSNRVGQVDSLGQTVFPNLIAFNGTVGEPGIAVSSVDAAALAINNSLRGNRIFSNSGIAIDLADASGLQRFDGPTANDFLDGDGGPNTLQNFPVITLANRNGPVLTVLGTLNTGIGGGQYFVDIYANGRHIGQTTPTVDNAGAASFNVTFTNANVLAGEVITATATQVINQSTSEHSAGVTVTSIIVPFDVVVESRTFASNAASPFFDVFIDAPPGVAAAIAGYNIGLRITPFASGVTLNSPIAGNDPLIAGTPDTFPIDPQVLFVADDVSSGTVAIADNKDFFRVPITIAPGTVGTFNVTIDPASFQLSDGLGVELDSSLFNLINGTITITAPPLEVSIGDPAPVTEGNAGTQTVIFPVTLSANPTSTVTVTVSTANNTAVAGGSSASGANDYVAKTQTFTFNPGGALTQNFTVTINGDTVKELNETFFANITTTTGPVTAITDSQGVGTINDNDTLPAILIDDPTFAEGDTGNTTGNFLISLTAPHASSNVTVQVTLGTATALQGVDFVDQNNVVVTFLPGETQKSFPVQIVGDFTVEANETFTATLASPSATATIGDNSGTATIIDNDTRIVTISDAQVVEGDESQVDMVFTVALNVPRNDGNVSVTLNTNSNTAVQNVDFDDVVNQLITFLPGETSKQVIVKINGEFFVEGNETFTAALSNFVGVDGAAAGADTVATGTIINNDTRVVTISDAQVVEGDDSQVDMVFTVALNVPRNDGDVSVTLNTNSNTAVQNVDFVDVVNQLITFQPGETSKQVIVKVNGEFFVEGNETFTAVLSNFVGVDGTAAGADAVATGTIINNDTRVVTISDAQVVEGDDSQVDMVFTVALNVSRNDGDVSVTLNTNSNTAVQNIDFVDVVDQLITFLPGETSKQVVVKVNGEFFVEGNETFTAVLSNFVGVDGAAAGADAVATGTIINNDTRVVTISDAQVFEGDAGQTDMVFTVALNVPRNDGNVSVTLNTNSNTASQNADFVDVVDQLITFLPGETSKQVIVKVIGDVLIEGDETFNAVLSAVTGADPAGPGADTAGVGTILDDDSRTLSISDAVVVEGDTGQSDLIFTVTLNQAHPSSNVTVTVNTNSGTAAQNIDFADVVDQVVTFLPGETSKQVIVKVNGDFDIEGDETLTATLSAATGAQIIDSSGTGTITNDDTRVITIADAQVVEGNSGQTDLVFTISLNVPRNDGDVTALFNTSSISASQGIDFDDVNNLLVTFAPGQTQRQVVVKINGDTTIEPDETFSATLSNVVGADGRTAVGGDTTAIGTILNDDVVIPVVSIDDVSITEGDTGTKQMVFNVTLNAPAGPGGVAVNFTTFDDTASSPSDFLAQTGSLSFAPGETAKTISITINGDFTAEANETFIVELSNLTGANFAPGGNQGTGTILNDDTRFMNIDDVSVSEGDAGTQQMVFNVTLNEPAGPGGVTVNFATFNGTAVSPSDFLAQTGSLTFAPGETAKTISITINGDTTVELDESFIVELSSLVGATFAAGGNQGTGTILNDDAANTAPVADAGGPYVVIEGGQIQLNAGGSTDAQQSTASLSYAWDFDSDGQFDDATGIAPLFSAANGPAAVTVSVRVTDSEGLSDIADATVNVANGLPVAVDDAFSTDEESVLQVVAPGILANDTDPGNDPLFVTHVNGNSALIGSAFALPSGAMLTLNSDGSFSYDPNGLFDFLRFGASFADSFNYSIVDVDGDIDEFATVFITINGVNDLPIAEANGPYSVLEGGAVQLSSAGSSDPDADDVLSFEWDLDGDGVFGETGVGALNGTETGAAPLFVAGALSAGTHNVTLRVTDSTGASATDVAQVVISSLPTISISDVTLAEGNGPGTTAFTFNVTISADPSAQVQVTAVTADGTATLADNDYQQLTGTPINFLPGGPLTQQVTVLVNGDATFEPNETFLVSLTGLTGPATIADGEAIGTISNDDGVPTISIDDVTQVETNAGTTAFTFTVSLSNPSAGPVSVLATTADGSALAFSGDYQSNSQTINFAAGVTSQQFTVLVNGDLGFEQDESFTVDLSNVIGTAVIADGQGVGTIVNDDPMPSLSISDVTRLEDEGSPGPTNYLFTVTLDRASDLQVSVEARTADGTATVADQDYPGIDIPIIFQPGETVRQFIVTVTPDNKFEPDESFFVDLLNPSNATIGDSRGEAVILNDDGVPSISVNDVTQGEGLGGTTELIFSVSLSNPSFLPISVDFQIADGTATAADGDYQPISGTVNFPAGASQPETVTVLINGDVRFERDETFFINLLNAVNATIADAQGTGTIANDDAAPGMNLIGGSVLEGNVAGDNRVVPFTLQLNAVSGVDVTGTLAVVSESATLGVDFVNITGQTFTIPAGTTQITVNVPVIEDTDIEGDETFQLIATADDPSTLSPSNIGGTASGSGTIQNDDFAAPTFTITDVTANEGDVGTTSFTFTVTLGGVVSGPASVTVNTADGSATVADNDFTAVNDLVLNFAAAGSQTVTVNVNGDTKFETNQTFSVNLSNATGGAVISDATGLGMITNDDARPTIIIAGANANEGDDLTFNLSLSNPSDETVTVLATVNDGTATVADNDYTDINGQLITFNPGVTSQQFVVQTIEDTKFEADQTVSVVLSGATNASGTSGSPATGTIVNDDARPTITITGASASEGDALTFNLTLSNPSDETVTVQATVNDGTATVADNDYTDVNGQLITFNPGVTAQSFVVQTIEDAKFETDQTVSVVLSGETNATGTIVNDDARPTITITGASASEGDALTFNLTLSNPSDEVVTVLATVNDGTATVADNDYTDINGQLITFNPGVTSQQFVVQTIEDTKFEADQTVSVVLSGATNASGTSGSPATGTIVNDDARPTITITGASASEGDALTFNLTLSNPSDEVVTVLATVNDGTATVADNDYTDINGQLITFNPGVTSQQFVVQTIEDTKFEADQTVSVVLSGATNASGTSGSPATGTIVNDDARPTITITGASASEGDALTFNLTLSNPSDETVTVQATVNDGTATVADNDYTDVNGQLITFNPGVTAQSFVVQTVEDTKFEADQTLSVALSGETNATGTSGSPATGTIVNDDARPTITITGASASEGDALTFNLSLSNLSDEQVSVLASTVDGIAAAGSDFTGVTNQAIVFAPGASTAQLVVASTEDGTVETAETFTVELSGAINAGGISGSPATGTIVDDDGVTTISVNDVAIAEGNAGSTKLDFTITLSAPSSQTITVLATITDGSATSEDYTAATPVLVTFTPGSTTRTVSASVLGDTKFEADQTFNITLSDPTNAVIADGAGVATILNDDARPTVTIRNANNNEGNQLTFAIELSHETDETVTLTASTNDGSATEADGDYVSFGDQPISIAPGVLLQTVTVQTNEDDKFEADETLTVLLKNLVGGVFGDDTGVGTIFNDDAQPAISIADRTVTETDGVSVELLQLTLSNPSAFPVSVVVDTVSGGATAGSDFGAIVGRTVTFNPGQTSITTPVNILGDTIREDLEGFLVNLSSPVGGTIADGQAIVTIQDNDPLPTISINDVTQNEGTGGTTAFTFTVTLSNGSQSDVLVTLQVNDGSATAADGDYIDGGTVLTFVNGGPLSQTFTVLVNADATFEANETFTVALSGAANAVIAAGDAGEGTGTILNDDGLTVSISDGQSVEGNVGDNGTIVFNVSLSAPPTELMTVNLSSFNGTATTADDDYLPLNTFLIFTPGGPTTQQVSVQLVGDDFFEFDETLEVQITGVAGSGATVADGTGVGTIINDDAQPTVSIGDVSRPENFGTTSFALGFPVTLSKAIKVPVTVSVAYSNGTATEGSDWTDDFGSSFVFVPGGSTSVLFPVRVIDDNIFELDETVLATITSATNATIADGSAVGTIINDDAPPTVTISNASVLEGNNGESNDLVFNVTLSHPSHEAIGIGVILGGSAVSESDYTDAVGATIPAGATTGTVRVRTIGDNRFELSETVTVEPFLVFGQAVLPTDVAIGTIINDDAAPVITIGNASVLEGDAGEITGLSFPVSISGETDLAATITLDTLDQTATGSGANRDYDGGPITIAFVPGGPTTKNVVYTVRGDDVVEGNETFALAATLPMINATVSGLGFGVGTIIDDDVPTISISDVTLDELSLLVPSRNFNFLVELSQPATQTITVDFATVDGSATTADGDYLAKSGTITFTPGSQFATVSVTVFTDTKFEQDQDFFVNLSNPVGATFADPQGKGTIRNDDQRPTITIEDAGNVTEGNLGTTPALFTIRLSNPSDEIVSVNASTADGSATSADNDYTPVSNLPIVFNPGQTELAAVAFVRGDTKFESDQTFRMVLTGATNSSGITDSEGVGTIVNDDSRPTVTITDAGNITEGNSGATPAVFNVTLSNASDEVVTVQVATQDGSATVANNDYQPVSTTLTFNPTGLLTQTVSVLVNGDTAFEPDETFRLNVQSTGNATVADGSGQAVIVNDDSNVVLAVQNIVVNDGAAQRSNIDRLEIQFTADANIQALIDSGQIVDAIKLRNTSTGQDVVLTANRFQFSAANRSLRIDLTTDGFGGGSVTLLQDGVHQLRLDTSLIAAIDGGSALVDGDGTADGIHRFNFHRLQGDFNGDGLVERTTDMALFNARYLSTIGSSRYDAAFDFNGDGRIDALDYAIMRRRLNQTLPPAIE